jgi:hypothetical protein
MTWDRGGGWFHFMHSESRGLVTTPSTPSFDSASLAPTAATTSVYLLAVVEIRTFYDKGVTWKGISLPCVYRAKPFTMAILQIRKYLNVTGFR